MGIDLDKFIQDKAREFYEGGMGTGGGHFPNLDDPDVVAEFLRDEIKDRMGLKHEIATDGGRPVQKVIGEDDVVNCLNSGWRYVGFLNGNKVIIER